MLYRITIPTILFSILMFIPKKIIRGQTIDIVSFVVETILGGGLWFTSALVSAEILLFILLLFRRKNIFFYLVSGIVLTCFAIYLTSWDMSLLGDAFIPWYYKSGMIAVLYMAFGGLFYRYEERIDSFFQNKVGGIVCSLFFIAFIIINVWLIRNDEMNTLDCLNVMLANGYTNVFSVLWALFSFIPIIYITKIYKGNIVTNWIGRHSIAFYFFCGAIPNLLAVALKNFFPGWNNPMGVICLWLLSLYLAYLITKFLNKYMPFLFDLRLLKCKYLYKKLKLNGDRYCFINE